MPNQQNNSLNQRPNSEHHYHISLPIFLVSIFLALLIGFVGFTFFNKVKAPTETSNSINTQPTNQTTPSITVDETANWETYINEEYGFEFKYPSSWEIINEIPEFYLAKEYPVNIPQTQMEEALNEYINSKMFLGDCKGPILQNKSVSTSIIAVDIPTGTHGLWCWSAGYFTDNYERQAMILDRNETINVNRWYIGPFLHPITEEDVDPEWKGDLFQTYYVGDDDFPVALVYQQGTDPNVEDVYDQILSTFQFQN